MKMENSSKMKKSNYSSLNTTAVHVCTKTNMHIKNNSADETLSSTENSTNISNKTGNNNIRDTLPMKGKS